jgi:hypothetical protein
MKIHSGEQIIKVRIDYQIFEEVVMPCNMQSSVESFDHFSIYFAVRIVNRADIVTGEILGPTQAANMIQDCFQ